MTTEKKLTKTQTEALNYITYKGRMLTNQQGLRALPKGAQSLVALGLVKIVEIDHFGTPATAYVLV
jgi:hypothetical protein